MYLDQESNAQPFGIWDSGPTNWAIWPGPEQIFLINKDSYNVNSVIIKYPVHVRPGGDTNYKELSVTEEGPVCQTKSVLAAIGWDNCVHKSWHLLIYCHFFYCGNINI